MAFILAGIVAFVTLSYALLTEFARMNMAAPSTQPSRFFGILIPGMIVAGLIAASHWLPRINW